MASAAISSLVPSRPSGTVVMAVLPPGSSVGVRRSSPSVPAIGPGQMALTRMFRAPYSNANTLVSWSTPALAAHTCAW